MVKAPKISAALEEKHKGETAISLLNGTVVGIGQDAVAALKKAKKIIPDIEEQEYVISRMHGAILIA